MFSSRNGAYVIAKSYPENSVSGYTSPPNTVKILCGKVLYVHVFTPAIQSDPRKIVTWM